MKFRSPRTWLPILGAGCLLLGPAAAAAQAVRLDVDEAVRMGLTQNLGLKATEMFESIAEGDRLDAMAGILPRFGGSYAYTESKSTTTLKDLPLEIRLNQGQRDVIRRGELPFDTDRKSSGFGFNVREDLSLTSWYGYRSAQAQVQSARYRREAAAQDVAYLVREQFYMVLRAQDLLKVQTDDLKLAQDQERRITSMFELGSVARVDVLKAQVRVSEAELALIRQQNQVDIEKARLATALGLPPATDLDLQGELRAPGAPLDSVAVVEESVGRPDLAQSRETIRAAANNQRAAVLSRIPGLFASFDWSTSAGSSKSDEFGQQAIAGIPNPGDTTLVTYTFPVDSDADFDGWTLRVGASLNLDAFLNMGWHKRAVAVKRQAEFQMSNLELEVQREIEEAILNYRASVKAIEAAESGVVSADEDLRLSQERYQQGLGTILELLEAQVAVTRARNNLVNALTGLKISEAALDKARGAELPS